MGAGVVFVFVAMVFELLGPMWGFDLLHVPVRPVVVCVFVFGSVLSVRGVGVYLDTWYCYTVLVPGTATGTLYALTVQGDTEITVEPSFLRLQISDSLENSRVRKVGYFTVFLPNGFLIF